MTIMALGPRFSRPINDKNKNKIKKYLIQFIPTFKSNFFRRDSVSFSLDTFNKTKFNFTHLLYKLKNNCHNYTNHSELIFFTKTKKCLKVNPRVILTKANTGNITVLMYKNDYEHKMLSLLSDNSTYQTKPRDIYNIQKESNHFIKLLKDQNAIDTNTYKNLTHNSAIAKIYGLIKIHKDDLSLRPMVSTISSPTYKLSSFVANIIKPLISDSNFNIIESLH